MKFGKRRARPVEGLWAAEIRQRLINVETKINDLLLRVPGQGEYTGSPDQRYGHLTFSQHGEDLVFVALFERFGIEHPTFLDIGANHPVNCSNTALLYRRGARGVNIDASPDVIALFQQARPDDINVNVGVAGKPGEMPFYRFDPTSGRNSFSREAMRKVIAEQPSLTITDEIMVPVMTLNQVVDTYCGGKYPDLLSVDAEGLDYEILEAATFETKPKILCVETLSGAGDNERALGQLLISRGFQKRIQMAANAIYVDKNIPL